MDAHTPISLPMKTCLHSEKSRDEITSDFTLLIKHQNHQYVALTIDHCIEHWQVDSLRKISQEEDQVEEEIERLEVYGCTHPDLFTYENVFRQREKEGWIHEWFHIVV